MDHGDRSTSAGVAPRCSARGCAATLEYRWHSRNRVRSVSALRARVGRQAGAVGELGQVDETSPAALPLASDRPGGPRSESAPCPRTVARHPRAGADLDRIRSTDVIPPPRAGSRPCASPTTSAPGKVTARSGSQGGAGSAGWRESPRQEREDWVTTIRAALSAGPDNDRDVVQRCRITHRPRGAMPSSDRAIGGRDRHALAAGAGRPPSGGTPPDRGSPCGG
jgi:hypothetical protein